MDEAAKLVTTTGEGEGEGEERPQDEATHLTTIPLVASPSAKFSNAELLWSQFLKNFTKRGSGHCKYPNPEVPEFYPRKMNVVCTKSDSTMAANLASSHTTVNTIQHNNDLDVHPVTSHQGFNDLCDISQLQGITHYYWTFHDPNLANLGRSSTELTSRAQAIKNVKDLEDVKIELGTKNQQLSHMNNVVKALLEEIWNMNETVTKHKLQERETAELRSTIEHFIKSDPANVNCNDCCSRFRDLAGQVCKQVERKIVKMHSQYKTKFVECVLSVIASSLQALVQCQPQNRADTEHTVRKVDMCTQTTPVPIFYNQVPMGVGRAARYINRLGHYKNKQQLTKVFRNRNHYKCRETSNSENWDEGQVTPTVTLESRIWRVNSLPHKATPAVRLPTEWYAPRNPIQLIHQKFKNLNCRLEGVPEKNMVKFSYIVDGNEFSAIARTKKEAQYHCAWHVLNSRKK